uniref:Uncharacterized protein n=1 Tax=Arundo donax TaxID=35708 RepID=A0A0A8ZK89_ARUDO
MNLVIIQPYSFLSCFGRRVNPRLYITMHTYQRTHTHTSVSHSSDA